MLSKHAAKILCLFIVAVIPMLSANPLHAAQLDVPVSIKLKLLEDGESVQLGTGKLAFAELPAKLKQGVETLSKAKLPVDNVTVTIAAEPAASASMLVETIAICHEVGIENFVLQFDRDYPTKIPVPKTEAEAAEKPAYPSMQILLLANDSGELDGVQVYARKMKDLAELRRHVLLVTGYDSGPKSFASTGVAEFHLDAGLQMKHVMDAFQLTAGSRESGGGFVPLLRNFRFVDSTKLKEQLDAESQKRLAKEPKATEKVPETVLEIPPFPNPAQNP